MNARRWTIVVAVYVAGGMAFACLLWLLANVAAPLFTAAKGGVLYLAVGGSAVLWVGCILLLHRSPAAVKKRMVVIGTFVGGLFYVLEFYLPAKSGIFFWRASHTNPFSPMLPTVGNAVMVISGFTFFLAAFSLSLVHAKNIVRRRPGYYNSIAFFVAFIGMAAFGLWQAYAPPARVLVRHFLWIDGLTVQQVYGYLFQSMYVPLAASLFSVLAFYMATAAFRAFRVRSAEAGFMMAAAFICMLGQVPLGMWLTRALPLTGPLSFLRMENLANWTLGVFSMSGLRAVGFGILVGYLAMSLRLWLSLERGAFFEQEL